MEDYSLNSICEKSLYLLLPFYLFNEENIFHLKEDEKDETKINNARDFVLDTLTQLTDRFKKEADDRRISPYEYESVVAMLEKVTLALNQSSERVQKEVENFMGGSVISYKAAEMRQEALDLGREKGHEDGAQETAVLVKKLSAQGRHSDIEKIDDPVFRKKLLAEFHMI